jgi:hypothetical protein
MQSIKQIKKTTKFYCILNFFSFPPLKVEHFVTRFTQLSASATDYCACQQLAENKKTMDFTKFQNGSSINEIYWGIIHLMHKVINTLVTLLAVILLIYKSLYTLLNFP